MPSRPLRPSVATLGPSINDQELAWTLVKTAPDRIPELENCTGCLFDCNPDGSIHQKAFAGQSFDRTLHRGDLTGIEIMTGRGSPHAGVYIDVSHLGTAFVERHFPGMVVCCRDVGFDLARERVEVSPTAHYLMGGVKIDPACRSNLGGLFVVGEDSGGVHGANRLGGNGVACSTVFGGIAGDSMAAYIGAKSLPAVAEAHPKAAMTLAMTPFDGSTGEDVYVLRDELKTLVWEKAGLVRHAADLEAAQKALAVLRERAQHVRVSSMPRLNAE
jgi:fumarate reductase flavoprotein subunit